jgi:hypothetical protein
LVSHRAGLLPCIDMGRGQFIRCGTPSTAATAALNGATSRHSPIRHVTGWQMWHACGSILHGRGSCRGTGKSSTCDGIRTSAVRGICACWYWPSDMPRQRCGVLTSSVYLRIPWRGACGGGSRGHRCCMLAVACCCSWGWRWAWHALGCLCRAWPFRCGCSRRCAGACNMHVRVTWCYMLACTVTFQIVPYPPPFCGSWSCH